MAPAQDRPGCKDGRELDRARPGKYVGLAALERAESKGDDERDVGGGGLSFGINSWHLRMLTEGAGLSYEEIGRMTPDQVYHRLCSEEVLKSKGGCRVATAEPASVRRNADGTVNGVDEDGNKIALKIAVGGKSVARRLMEEAEAKEVK